MESGKTMILAWVIQKKFKLSNIENNTMKFVLDGLKVFKKLFTVGVDHMMLLWLHRTIFVLGPLSTM